MSPSPFIRTCLWLLALGTMVLRAVAQEPADETTYDKEAGQYFARTWQLDDGLPRNTITALAQTPDGYLWLGTSYGLIRFDGITFTPMEDDYFAPFGRARTRALYVDERGRLWIGTGTAGIIRLEGDRFKVIDREHGLPNPTVTSLCEDASGKLWVATTDGSVSWVTDEDTVHSVGLLQEGNSAEIQFVRDVHGGIWFSQGNTYGQLVEGRVTNAATISAGWAAVCPSREGGIWISEESRLRRVPSPASGSESWTVPLPLTIGLMPCLLEDRQGAVWLGTHGQGLFRYAKGRLTKELDTTHRIRALFEDAEANLWAGTGGGGISRLRPRLFHIVSPRPASPQATVVSLCEDRDGSIWLSPQGFGLARWSEAGGLNTFDTLKWHTTVVQPHPDGGIWFGTVNQGLFWQREDETCTQWPEPYAFRNRQVRVLHQGSRGELWIGCLPNGLACLSGGKLIRPQVFSDLGLTQQAIWAIADDSQGRLWLGTIRGELWCYDGTRFSSFGIEHGLPGSSIGALHAATNGDLWIGTLGGGLGRYRDGRFVFADVRHGLADDVISAVVEDGLGYFWIASERGLFRLNQRDLEDFADGKRATLASMVYGRDDGLANVECEGGYQPAAWRTRSGTLWFATSKGAVTVNPASLPLNAKPPPLVMQDILVDGVALTNRSDWKLEYGYRELQFRYAAASFSAPERIRFRRQLVGFDTDWVEAGPSRTAVYPRLDPGRYVFRFTARNADGVWNDDPVSLAFEVTPAFWQTMWFRMVAVLAFAALVAGLVRQRYVRKMRRKVLELEQAHAVEQERMRIAQDIHDDLGARLTQIAFLSEMTAGEIGTGGKAGGRMEKIAQGSRQAIRSLEEIVWAVNPRKDSLPHLVDYLSHYANEFFRPTDIRCRQDLPLSIPEIPLPADIRHHLFLACKEALNNVHKHARASEVWLRLEVAEASLTVVIEDNGVGFVPPGAASTGNGLPNLRTRLAALGGRCEIEAKPGAGTRVRMMVPLSPTADVPATRPNSA